MSLHSRLGFDSIDVRNIDITDFNDIKGVEDSASTLENATKDEFRGMVINVRNDLLGGIASRNMPSLYLAGDEIISFEHVDSLERAWHGIYEIRYKAYPEIIKYGGDLARMSDDERGIYLAKLDANGKARAKRAIGYADKAKKDIPKMAQESANESMRKRKRRFDNLAVLSGYEIDAMEDIRKKIAAKVVPSRPEMKSVVGSVERVIVAVSENRLRREQDLMGVRHPSWQHQVVMHSISDNSVLTPQEIYSVYSYWAGVSIEYRKECTPFFNEAANATRDFMRKNGIEESLEK